MRSVKLKNIDYLELAKEVYKTLHEDAPPDVQTWEQLHRVERDYLVKFTREIAISVQIAR